jgi:exonuclease III
VTLEFERLALTIAYVPNAGEGLKRLDFRVDEWERDMRAHLTALAAGGKLTVVGGDLPLAKPTTPPMPEDPKPDAPKPDEKKP